MANLKETAVCLFQVEKERWRPVGKERQSVLHDPRRTVTVMLAACTSPDFRHAGADHLPGQDQTALCSAGSRRTPLVRISYSAESRRHVAAEAADSPSGQLQDGQEVATSTAVATDSVTTTNSRAEKQVDAMRVVCCFLESRMWISLRNSNT